LAYLLVDYEELSLLQEKVCFKTGHHQRIGGMVLFDVNPGLTS